MAITGPWITKAGTPARAAATTGLRRQGMPSLAALAAAAAVLVPPPAQAQQLTTQAGVSTQLTWSSNPELGVSSGGRDDTILDVRPHISLRREGRRVRLAGSAALNALASANGTQKSRVLPEADLNGRVEAVERLFFVDAGLRAVQVSQDPFGARPETSSHSNTLTTTQARLSPSFEWEQGPDTRYRLRSDNSWTRQSTAEDVPQTSSAEGYFGRHAALIESDPRPLGWRLEAERSETRYRDNTQEPLIFDLARASIDYAVAADWTAGIRMGREHTSVLPEDDQDRNIVGAQARWQPSPRTLLQGFREKRFFGSSWRLTFNHRMPRLTWNLALSRTLDTAPQALFDLPPTENVAGLLDAMFTTRFPDPAQRAQVVQDLLARQGLPAQTLRPTEIFTRRVSIVTRRTASLAYVAARSSVTVSAFQARIEDATPSSPLATGTALDNNTQRGASLALSHRLTPTTGLSLSTDWSRIQALAAPDRSIERTARLRLNMQATPKTALFAGVRYREIDSNVAVEGREGAVFVGLDYTF